MSKYRVTISMNIVPAPDDPLYTQAGSSLWHSQNFEFEGENFGDVAPTIDGLYAAIRQVVEANGGNSH